MPFASPPLLLFHREMGVVGLGVEVGEAICNSVGSTCAEAETVCSVSKSKQESTYMSLTCYDLQ